MKILRTLAAHPHSPLLGSPEAWCHRAVSAWLFEDLGLEVCEVGHEALDYGWQHPKLDPRMLSMATMIEWFKGMGALSGLMSLGIILYNKAVSGRPIVYPTRSNNPSRRPVIDDLQPGQSGLAPSFTP
jgi:hypothetical protein